MIVELSHSEVHSIRNIASTRTLIMRNSYREDKKISNRDAYEIELDGCLSEYAFCKWHNIHWDIEFNMGTNGKPDCIYNDLKVDVKSTRSENPVLMIKNNASPMDIYVLAQVISEYKINFVGYAREEDIKKAENIVTFNGTDMYRLTVDKLLKFRKNEKK
jgi:hypothetical protein